MPLFRGGACVIGFTNVKKGKTSEGNSTKAGGRVKAINCIS